MDQEQREKILKAFPTGCRCMSVSVAKIKGAIDKGADTVEKVSARTSAGTGCGRCKKLIEVLIEEKQNESN